CVLTGEICTRQFRDPHSVTDSVTRLESRPGGHQSAMTKWLAVLLALVLPVAACSATNAQESYPARPIRLILPFPAGGAVDLVAPLVTARVAEDLGRSFVIENKAGAGGVIATDATAKGDAGRLHASAYHAQFVPVSVVAEVPELLVSHPSAPFETFAG